MIARQNKQDFDNDKLTKLISDIIEEKPESKYMEGTHLYFAIKHKQATSFFENTLMLFLIHIFKGVFIWNMKFLMEL